MKKLLTGLFIFATIATSVFAMNYNDAKTQTKPIILFFQMNRCSACKDFKPTYEKAEKKYSEKFNFVKDDVTMSNLSSKFKVSSVPSVFIVEPKTEKSTQISYSCLMNEKCFNNTLEKY